MNEKTTPTLVKEPQRLVLATEAEIIQKGIGLGTAHGLVTETEIERTRNWRGQSAVNYMKDNGNLVIFCGERNGTAAAYLNQKLLVENCEKEMEISIGVDETGGKKRYWLMIVGEMSIEITENGGVYFRDGSGKLTDVTRLSEKARVSLVSDEQLKKMVVAMASIERIKNLMGQMVRHEIFNPYMPWGRKKIIDRMCN